MLKRRALFGLLFAALGFAGMLALVAIPGADAERYQNKSGLVAGHFVWSPTLATRGPVTIVVSPAERSAHIYRDGVEIGITTIASADAGAFAGVVLVSEVDGRIADGQSNKPLVWRGMELFTGSAPRLAEAGFRASLPPELARLLMGITHRGAAVIVARERSGPQVFSAPGPFVDPMETGSISRVARFARPELRAQLQGGEENVSSAQAEQKAGHMPTGAVEASGPSAKQAPAAGLAQQRREPARMATRSPDAGARVGVPEAITGVRGEITSIIVSRADLSAYVLQEGRIVDRLPIAVDAPTQAFGLHTAVLLAPGDASREARWLAFGLDDDPGAVHVTDERAEQVLRRVRFLDRGRSAALARSLRAGTLLVLMDGHGPSATQAPRLDVAVLTSEPVAPGASVTEPGPSPGAAAGAAASAPVRSRAAGRRGSARNAGTSQKSGSPTPRRRRGPLDHREAWPNSFYWPY